MPSYQTPITSTIVQGAAHLYVSTSATPTFPEDATDTAALAAGTFDGWVSCGKTTEDGAVKLVDTPTVNEIKSAQAARTEAVYISGWEASVETTLLQPTLAAIARQIAGTAGASDVAGSAQGFMPVMGLAIVGPWSNGDSSLLVVEFAALDNGLELAFSQKETSTIPVKFKVLEGSVYPSGYKVTIL